MDLNSKSEFKHGGEMRENAPETVVTQSQLVPNFLPEIYSFF